MNDFVTDFLQGQMDCSKGIPHEEGKGEAYDRGYAAEYESEQVMNEVMRNAS